MASTKEISAQYSIRLNEMARFVGAYAHSGLDERDRHRLHAALQVFFLNNTQEFRQDFLRSAGIEDYGDKTLPGLLETKEYDQFLSHLASLRGECVFLLKDAWSLMLQYQEKTEKGFGMLVNRHFLEEKDQEEDYFALIQPMYQALENACDLDSFLDEYERRIASLIDGSPHWRGRSKLIAEYVVSRASERIVWVDIGFQFTFILFCRASVRYHFPNAEIEQDFVMFTAYPWLAKIFEGKYFSHECAGALAFEQAGIKAYQEAITDRATGMVVGFAIGDALGFPVAGINQPDLEKMIPLPVKGFTDNSKHPYFGHLKPGQYTDNSNTLLLAANHLAEHGGLDMDAYCQELVEWAAAKRPGRVTDRWLGPTAQAAIQKLAEGADWQFSGSTTTESCSSLYRVLPLGIVRRPLKEEASEFLTKTAEELGSVTHNSAISRTGAALSVLIIGELASGALPVRAVRGALNSVQGAQESERLIDCMNQAVQYATLSKSDKEARERLGTGSPVWQTLPLATFYFLKYQDDFKAGVLAAANSYRNDTPEERDRVSRLSWEEQLIEARGGNSDGIAALTGAFLGAYRGYSSIPAALLSVENRDGLLVAGSRLAKS